MSIKRNLLVSAAGLAIAASAAHAEEITIATVNNGDMIIMQELSSQWEEETGNTINWVTLEENVLRQRVTTDIATGGGQYDIMTIGSYEAPIWGAQGWLEPVGDIEGYDYDDLIPAVREGLSHEGTLYALPFYAESSFTLYRTDLFEEAGLEMPDQPTYEQIAQFAETLTDRENELYGLCLRGKPGWGENMAFIGTLVNTFGGRWFDENWVPQLDQQPWNDALTYYLDVMEKYGPPGATSNGYNENQALFQTGKCAMWIDATSAAGRVFDPSQSDIAEHVGFTAAPIAETDKGNAWFWAWSLAIPTSSSKTEVAKDFLAWATSEDYVNLVGEEKGWVAVPPGTRVSTYENQNYIDAAPFAETVLNSIKAADPSDPTAEPVPYTGIQYVSIPEFQGIGTMVGQQFSAALAGQKSAEEALQAAQQSTMQEMQAAGYTQ
ncbi:multiple sugar transport system substrate-binding protein/sorbitol/mannitol transport system substrate-binding protein [Limimaricola variabilis]|uniref:Multiple sugar transport system substrate-binding protein/sorbitol/mannitol transport system substrate-binding protein n=1 Tax=Limimaricola variabilis TaxID=1492771 RepID=A0ABR6HR71_9RHOB|nr:sugar ABC transporter substrate-binding protein [Limimaricola variabilis]MBB3713040.1 multiple sugar transport system substrate-binding protein/sorbitol/mannitol transport system substrate-binding protein [Limimaricola variabilis]